MHTEKSKKNEPRKVASNLSQILDLRSSNKRVALQNLHMETYKTKVKKTIN